MSTAAPKIATVPFGPAEEDLTTRDWSLDESYKYCERLARSHYENFPVGSILIKKPLRRYFYAIYAFARTADDFADEGYGTDAWSEPERLGWIARWNEQLKDAYRGRALHPVFIALADTAERFDLPVTLFEDLLSAFSQDVTVRRYKTFDDVVDYCRRSANPIGRLILLLFGERSAECLAQSDDICTGLQLANHWQDVRIDLDKDRVYLPEEDLFRFGLSVESIRQEGASEKFKRLMSFEVTRARSLFLKGKPLCTRMTGRLGMELRVVWLGGVTILNRIEHNDYDVFNRRPSIGSSDKLKILLTAARKAAFHSYK